MRSKVSLKPLADRERQRPVPPRVSSSYEDRERERPRPNNSFEDRERERIKPSNVFENGDRDQTRSPSVFETSRDKPNAPNSPFQDRDRDRPQSPNKVLFEDEDREIAEQRPKSPKPSFVPTSTTSFPSSFGNGKKEYIWYIINTETFIY
jgi:hypothetical protein